MLKDQWSDNCKYDNFQSISEPVYDEDGMWQSTSTGNSLSDSSLLNHIDTTSYSTHHYVFLTHVDESPLTLTKYLGSYNLNPAACYISSSGKLIIKWAYCRF